MQGFSFVLLGEVRVKAAILHVVFLVKLCTTGKNSYDVCKDIFTKLITLLTKVFLIIIFFNVLTHLVIVSSKMS